MEEKQIRSVQDIANNFLSDFKDIEESDDLSTEVLSDETDENTIFNDNNSSDIVESKNELDFSDIFSDF